MTTTTTPELAALLATFDADTVADLRAAGYSARDIARAILADSDDEIRRFRADAREAGDDSAVTVATDALREPMTAGSPADCARRTVAGWMLEAAACAAYARV